MINWICGAICGSGATLLLYSLMVGKRIQEEHGVKYAVITLSGKSGISVNLGTYTTEYKALAVLNDIQEWYECSYGETFQMPQDEEVEL